MVSDTADYAVKDGFVLPEEDEEDDEKQGIVSDGIMEGWM